MAGYHLIKEIEELHQVLVYKIIAKNKYELVADIVLDEKYRSFSKTFEFCYRKDLFDAEGKSLLMLNNAEIVCLRFMQKNDLFTTVYKFEN